MRVGGKGCHARLSLSSLGLVQGIGVPEFSKPCGFEGGGPDCTERCALQAPHVSVDQRFHIQAAKNVSTRSYLDGY